METALSTAPISLKYKEHFYYRPQRSSGKVIFSEACVKNSVRGGMRGGRGVRGCGGTCVVGGAWQGVHGSRACMGGVHDRGHVWQGACMAGGMCGRGACVAGGHVWLRGMHGRGCVWQGACVAGGYAWHNEIQSMSECYASYWNAFLFL